MRTSLFSSGRPSEMSFIQQRTAPRFQCIPCPPIRPKIWSLSPGWRALSTGVDEHIRIIQVALTLLFHSWTTFMMNWLSWPSSERFPLALMTLYAPSPVLDKSSRQAVSHPIAQKHGPDAYQPLWDVYSVFCTFSFTEEAPQKAISSVIHFSFPFLFHYIVLCLSEQEQSPQMVRYFCSRLGYIEAKAASSRRS